MEVVRMGLEGVVVTKGGRDNQEDDGNGGGIRGAVDGYQGHELQQS